MRRFIAGLVVGVVIAMALPALATEVLEPTPVEREKPITLVVNGQTITLPDAQPRVVDGQVMVPVVAFSRVAGFGVTWDEANRTLSVTTPVKSSEGKPATTAPTKAIVIDGIAWYRLDALVDLLAQKYSDKRVAYGSDGFYIGDYHAQTRFHRTEKGYIYVDASPLVDDGMVTLNELNRIDDYGR